MVRASKNLTISGEPYEALFAYRANPLENGFSPAELCMVRRLRITLPKTPSKLIPSWPKLTRLRETETKLKTKQTEDYNRRHAVKEVSNLSPGDRVYILDRKENAVVVDKHLNLVPITSKPNLVNGYACILFVSSRSEENGWPRGPGVNDILTLDRGKGKNPQSLDPPRLLHQG